MTYTRRYENFLIAVLFLTWGTVFLDRMAQLYLAPYIIADLHMSNEQVGIMASVTGLAWAVSTVLFGALSDRIGRRTVLIPAVFAFSLLSWISGMAHSYEQLLLIRALLGFAEGPCFSVIMALMEESSEPKRRATNIGLVISAASLVGLGVAPVLTTQIAGHFGWRWAFFVAGLPGIILGLMIIFYVAEPRTQADNPAARAGKSAGPASIGEFFSVLRYRNVLLCCVGAACNLTLLFLLNVFGPLYITQVAGQAPTTAGFILGATGLGAFIWGFVLPGLSDKTGRKPMLLINAFTSGLVPLLLLVPMLYANLWLMALLLIAFTGGQSIAALTQVIIPTETNSAPSRSRGHRARDDVRRIRRRHRGACYRRQAGPVAWLGADALGCRRFDGRPVLRDTVHARNGGSSRRRRSRRSPHRRRASLLKRRGWLAAVSYGAR